MKVARTGMRTGQLCELEEWVEIARDISSPYMLQKTTASREIRWELEGVCPGTRGVG